MEPKGAGLIDDLTYDYPSEPSVLGTVSDGVTDPLAQPEGFGKISAVSGYGYDGAGNIISDGGKGLEIAYNYLNLPKRVYHQSTGAEMLIDYALRLRSGQRLWRSQAPDNDHRCRRQHFRAPLLRRL